jgi:hypothetical protein
MRRSLLLVVLVCAIATSALAADLQWFGGATPDRSWNNAANWNSNLIPPGPVPTGVDKAKINYVWANPGPIVNASGAAANEIFISEDRDLGTVGEQSLTVATNGILTANGQVILGYYGADSRAGLPANEGRLIIAGGTANLMSHLFVGFGGIGHLEVDSGTLNVSGMFAPGWNGGSGTINLNGGLLHTTQWWGGVPTNPTYTFDITGGQWIEDNYWVPQIQALADAGKITGYGGAGTVNVTWDPVLQQTHVTATIPEPVSICLVGLGALLLRRRS